MSQRTQFGLACFLVGLLVGMFIITLLPGLITDIVLVLAIGLLAAMVEMRYHIVQSLLRRRSTRRSAPTPVTPRASRSQQSNYRR